MHGNLISCMEDIIRADGSTVDMDGLKHLEPAEGMLPEGKAARHDAAHGAALVHGPGRIGQNPHGSPSFSGQIGCGHYTTAYGELTKGTAQGTINLWNISGFPV